MPALPEHRSAGVAGNNSKGTLFLCELREGSEGRDTFGGSNKREREKMDKKN